MSESTVAKQPIEITYKTLNDQNFINALRGLVNYKFDAFTISYKLSRILAKVDSESDKAMKLWRAHQDKIEWEGEGNQRVPKDKEVYEKMESEFLALSVDFGKWTKINIQELLGYKFSAVEMMALTPILAGLEELNEGEGD